MSFRTCRLTAPQTGKTNRIQISMTYFHIKFNCNILRFRFEPK